jgi:hypothetical protein
MSYASVDALQRTLADTVFHYTIDKKKAAGRALGTLVEIITFYTLKSWGFRDSIVIERRLPEFANADITHNVEYSLHPILTRTTHTLSEITLPLTAAKLRRLMPSRETPGSPTVDKATELLSMDGTVRNACTISETAEGISVVSVDKHAKSSYDVGLVFLHKHPFAIFECKRVGIEEGMKKGPQTIEKAKQGAYVARSVSSLQKVRLRDGQMHGVIQRSDGSLYSKPYQKLLREVVDSNDAELLEGFVLTVGVVSNHGNWFTAENHNKELKVLAQSYDWLLFLTDRGLAEFIDELLLNPKRELAPARDAFLASYSGKKGKNRFTKVRMDLQADKVLQDYFKANAPRVEAWFNVITPKNNSLGLLRDELTALRDKNWKKIFDL